MSVPGGSICGRPGFENPVRGKGYSYCKACNAQAQREFRQRQADKVRRLEEELSRALAENEELKKQLEEKMSKKLELAVDVQGGRVIVIFGQPVQNFSLTPRDAHQFGAFIQQKAEEAASGVVKPGNGKPSNFILPPGYGEN